MGLSIKLRTTSEVVILDLSGSPWVHDAGLQNRMNLLLENGSRCFVINLAGIEFVESSGLGQLISLWTSVKNRGGRMSVFGPTDRVRKSLKLTKLDSVFDVFQNEDEAIRHVQPEA